jgi:4-amino-4-deoxy-L-arabinose transferase-like glycosyltransferase
MIEYLSRKSWLVFFIFLLLLIPALLINLGVHPLLNDEAIRSVVAMEMIFSDDYITPTIAGEIYLKKPPVYNWFIVLFFKITGNYNELTVRLVAVVSLIIYSIIIFFTTRPLIGRGNAFLAALMFITCGRILYYDSFYGLIDIAFSALVYLNMMSIFHLYKRQKYWLLFLVTYALTGITFLMKGLPSVYFQAASLLTWFIYRKNFRKLISVSHFTGILLFIIIIGSYYLVYLKRNPGTLPDIVKTLFSESTQKTALGVSLMKTLKHFFTFPFEFLYHFVPWTVFIIYILRKKTQELIRQDEFMIFSLLLFAANILIFWFSPDTYGRFLFIHASLLIPVLLLIHKENQVAGSIHFRIVTYLFLLTGSVIALISVGFAVSPLTNFVPAPVLVSILTSAAICALVYLTWKYGNWQIYIFAALLLVFRIGFDWFILPSREQTSKASVCRDRAIEIAQKYKPDQLRFIKSTKLPVHTIYYLTREWKEPVGTVDKPSEEGNYIIYEPEYSGGDYIRIEEFPSTEMDKVYSIVKFGP